MGFNATDGNLVDKDAAVYCLLENAGDTTTASSLRDEQFMNSLNSAPCEQRSAGENKNLPLHGSVWEI